MSRICGTCLYSTQEPSEGIWVCDNDECENFGLYIAYDDSCEEWEGKDE